uniref:Uncharacterized protein n=4 Tax=Chaetoceros debilis TaxID=122233 RepID=A0A7S3QH75_9STRA|mmetsp:Transcript_20807/g.31596  ORF Transcript_20807/g.31596 Transcript_20807/m.31596 type:complete len:315 (+) Transcript_20807:151-1095(+)|eukprot:CAMPEP_0194078504 /NCGR_PEP_ID=MMETSP0149-20130528/4875_1 /TAXON_ID=122233 /ORGANISM="Chaetoceros debilis, Strain MM31A-1" /LENGTH=314 /DNA_ID=CAMNT_0038759779 /DNA_START=147 /DNA_END=1091 /DNA_ORIENTATION=+
MGQSYLDPENTKRDGLAFLGLSFSRRSEEGHSDSVTHQTAFDLNEIQDREYVYVESTNDDGWLIGGGEPGPPKSYKLAAKDSSHVEIMRIGTFNPEWGGLSVEDIVTAIESGNIHIPQIEVVPTAVIANPDKPPELEIRFDMDPAAPDFDDMSTPLPVNWQLRFIHNQLFKYFQFPSRFCPGPFHSTFTRKAQFRSRQHEKDYFTHCEEVVQKWRNEGVKPLNNGGWDINGDRLKEPNEDGYNSGLYLFADRNNITHYFKPNFLPPYDTPEKKDVILSFLQEEWDEDALAWRPVCSTVEKALQLLRRSSKLTIF